MDIDKIEFIWVSWNKQISDFIFFLVTSIHLLCIFNHLLAIQAFIDNI